MLILFILTVCVVVRILILNGFFSALEMTIQTSTVFQLYTILPYLDLLQGKIVIVLI